MKYTFTLFALVTIFLFGCGNKTEQGEATLEWHGEYAVDGCGYFIKLADSVMLKPIDESVIPDTFKSKFSTTVNIEYKLPEDKINYACGLMAYNQDAIELISITNK